MEKKCCILFHFYIKPQLFDIEFNNIFVVSYSISTSNHNRYNNWRKDMLVVSYSISTSNHNLIRMTLILNMLYLIPFLHQTTTENLALIQ